MKPSLPVLGDVGVSSTHNHLTRSNWLVVWMLLTLVQHGFGTSVLIIETFDNVLYVAADSLQSDPESGYTRHYCKIIKLNNVYWAAATNFYVHVSTGFELEKLVSSIGTQGSVDSTMRRFIKSVTVPLQQEVISAEKENPAEYAHYVAGEWSPLHIGFVGIENGKPAFAITDFIVSKVNGRVAIKAVGADNIRTKPTREKPIAAFGFGDYTLALPYLQAHYAQLVINPTRTIRESLETEHAGHPDHVDGPFTILRLDRNGPTWMQKGECDQ